MADRNEWDDISGRRGGLLHAAGMGILRVTLLFGSGAVALALILTPLADQKARPLASRLTPLGLDPVSTGSVPMGASRDTYIIRRSVLQKSPFGNCIIGPSGDRRGNC